MADPKNQSAPQPPPYSVHPSPYQQRPGSANSPIPIAVPQQQYGQAQPLPIRYFLPPDQPGYVYPPPPPPTTQGNLISLYDPIPNTGHAIPHPQPAQLQQPTPGGIEAFVLVRQILPIAAGESVPAQAPTWQQLVPMKYTHQGLPVYGPFEYPKPGSAAVPEKAGGASNAVKPAAAKPVDSVKAGRLAAEAALGAEAVKAAKSVPIVNVPPKPKLIIHLVCSAYKSRQINRNSPTGPEEDQPLCDTGEAQARSLRSCFTYMNKIQYVLCSPMRAALDTTNIVFGNRLKETNMKAIAFQGLCDTGVHYSPRLIGSKHKVFVKAHGDSIVDFRLVNGDDCTSKRWVKNHAGNPGDSSDRMLDCLLGFAN